MEWFKEIQWGETLIPAEQFAGIGEGQKLEIVVRDVKPNAKVYLRQNRKVEGQPNRPNLSFSEQYGHIVNLTEGRDEKTYIVELEPKYYQRVEAVWFSHNRTGLLLT